MCNRAVSLHNFRLSQNVPDWFEGLIQQKTKIWYNTGYLCITFYDDSLIEWYEGYKRRKTQKAKIKKELLPNA